MGLVDRNAERNRAPMLAWRGLYLPTPDFDVEKMRLGPIGLGDPLEAAEPLGRPDLFEWSGEGSSMLLYAAAGYQLEFEGNRLRYIAFFIGPDEFVPPVMGFKFARPRLAGCERTDAQLSADSDPGAIREMFGEPDSVDADDPAETILVYERNAVTMEFEMNGTTNKLKRWNLFPSEQ